MSDNNHAPNFFWPIILVGAGVILLLSNLGMYQFEMLDLVSLVQLWPLLLVAMGINLLFGRNRSWVGSLLSLVMGLVVVAFFVLAPSYIQPIASEDFIVETFSEPIAGASSARVTLDFDRGTLQVYPLADSPNLAEVEVTHNQNLDYRAAGDDRRTVTVRLDSGASFGFVDFLEEQQIVGQVGLTPDLPIDLSVDVGGGDAELDLQGLNLSGLEVNSGSGSIDLAHPAGSLRATLGTGSGSIDVLTISGTVLDLKAEVGSGRITLEIAEGVYGEVELQSGSGGITVYVPEGVAVMVSGTTGSGSVNLPNDFERISGSGQIAGDSGTWISPNYQTAEQQLVIEFSIGSGSFRLVYQ